MDKTEVTNEQYEKFTRATGYVTVAERTPTQAEFPDAPPENLVAGSTVFTPTPEPVPLDSHFRWWRYERGANWRHPDGPESDLKDARNIPPFTSPSRTQSRTRNGPANACPPRPNGNSPRAAGLTGKLYAWGDDLKPGDRAVANTFQGVFPVKDTAEDGFPGIAPVAQFPTNGYGLYDIGGNVWEWCSDWYRPDTYVTDRIAANITRNPQGPETSFDPAEPTEKKRVHRGGSFLCTDQYCTRYMVGTRGKGEISTGSNHVGFRCVKTP